MPIRTVGEKILLFLAISSFPVVAYPDFDEYLGLLVERIEERNRMVFYTSCHKGAESYLLFYEGGGSVSYLIEKEDVDVVNLSSINIRKKGVFIEETHGGIYSRSRVRNLFLLLSQKSFEVHRGEGFIDILSKRPQDSC